MPATDPTLTDYVNRRYVVSRPFLAGEYTCGSRIVVTGVSSSGHLICARASDGGAAFQIAPETLATLATRE